MTTTDPETITTPAPVCLLCGAAFDATNGKWTRTPGGGWIHCDRAPGQPRANDAKVWEEVT